MKESEREAISRARELIDGLVDLPESRLPSKMQRLADGGESEEALTFVRTFFDLEGPVDVEFRAGDTVGGRYDIVRELGRGGMGLVYEATQQLTNRNVALKIIHPKLGSPDIVTRFQEEIATLAKLNHPGIVSIFDAGTETAKRLSRDLVFFSMQLIDGQPITHWIRENNVTIAQRLDLLVDTCEAVQAAHDLGIIHRDLKPGNLLVTADRRPVILDFGLATIADRLLESETDGECEAFAISGLSGSPRYMSPEQFQGTAGEFGAGQSIDVYALGVIAYEVIAGGSPYAFPPDPSWAEMSRCVIEDPPARIDGQESLNKVIAKALRKDPADRYYTASGLARALARVRSEMSSSEEDETNVWHPSVGGTVPATDWKLVEQIGEGGIGQVWLARRDASDVEGANFQTRVFKFCEDEDRVRSLKREASLFRLLKEKIGQHPNFVRIYDVSLDDPPYYIAMDYVSGGDFEYWSEHVGGIDSVSTETKANVVAQAATAIQAAHDAGIIHRDIKPSNLLIEHGHNSDTGIKVFVADFGIGEIQTGIADQGQTRLGFTNTLDGSELESYAGTRLYVAPEVLSGEAATVRSDIYSLGIILYQALANNFGKALTVDWERNISDPLLAQDLRACFAGTPQARFSSAQQLAANLNSLGERRAAAEEAEVLQQRRIAAAARTAYWRGVVRTTSIALVVTVALAWSVWFSYQKYLNESQLRVAQSQSLRLTSQVDWRRRSLDLIREADRQFPDSDVFSLRNEALAALASPYGRSTSLIGSVSHGTDIAVAGAWLSWLERGIVRVAKMTSSGLEHKTLVSRQMVSRSVVTNDGSVVAVVSKGSDLFVSDASETFHRLHGPCGTEGLAVHSDGWIAVPGAEGQVLLFNRKDGIWLLDKTLGIAPPRLSDSVSGEFPDGTIIASAELLAFSPNGRYLAVGGHSSLNIQIWDIPNGALICHCPHRHHPIAVNWDSENPGILWTASFDGGVYGWDDFERSSLRAAHEPWVARHPQPGSTPYHVLGSSPSGTYLVCTSANGSRTFLWKDTLRLDEVQENTGFVAGGYLPTGELWTLNQDGNISMGTKRDWLSRTWKVGFSPVTRMVRSADDALVAATCGTEVIIRDAGALESWESLQANSKVVAAAFSGDGARLVATGLTNVYEWRRQDESSIAEFTRSKIHSEYPKAGEAIFLRHQKDDWLVLSESSILKTVPAFPWGIPATKTITALAAGRETPWFAASRGGGEATTLYFVADGATRSLPAPPETVYGLATSPDGSLIVERTARRVIVTNPKLNKAIADFDLPFTPGNAGGAPIALSDDGKLVAATTFGSRIVLIGVDRSEALAELRLETGSSPTALLFTRSGALVVGTTDGYIWMWKLPQLREDLRELGLDWNPPAGLSVDIPVIRPVYRES